MKLKLNLTNNGYIYGIYSIVEPIFFIDYTNFWFELFNQK
jgi:hypothetical protein